MCGHPGEDDVGSFVLQAVGATKLPVPFITSGGVSVGRQLAAAFALGAEGVNIGTLFCCCKESPWPQSYKDRVVVSTEIDTALVNRSLKNTSRMFGNKVAKEIVRIERENWNNMEYSKIAHLISGARGRKAERDEDPDAGQWSAGQGIGLIDDTPTVAQAIRRLINEAEQTIHARLGGIMTGISQVSPETPTPGVLPPSMLSSSSPSLLAPTSKL